MSGMLQSRGSQSQTWLSDWTTAWVTLHQHPGNREEKLFPLNRDSHRLQQRLSPGWVLEKDWALAIVTAAMMNRSFSWAVWDVQFQDEVRVTIDTVDWVSIFGFFELQRKKHLIKKIEHNFLLMWSSGILIRKTSLNGEAQHWGSPLLDIEVAIILLSYLPITQVLNKYPFFSTSSYHEEVICGWISTIRVHISYKWYKLDSRHFIHICPRNLSKKKEGMTENLH